MKGQNRRKKLSKICELARKRMKNRDKKVAEIDEGRKWPEKNYQNVDKKVVKKVTKKVVKKWPKKCSKKWSKKWPKSDQKKWPKSGQKSGQQWSKKSSKKWSKSCQKVVKNVVKMFSTWSYFAEKMGKKWTKNGPKKHKIPKLARNWKKVWNRFLNRRRASGIITIVRFMLFWRILRNIPQRLRSISRLAVRIMRIRLRHLETEIFRNKEFLLKITKKVGKLLWQNKIENSKIHWKLDAKINQKCEKLSNTQGVRKLILKIQEK